MTNKENTKRLFIAGRLLPHCPACGSEHVQGVKKVVINRIIPVMGIVCKVCSERFIAWIA